MSSSLKDFLDVASELSESTNEAKLRASIGRSYYSAFHLGLAYLDISDTRQWTGGHGGVHEKLIGEFEYSANKPIAYILRSLKIKRHLADYHLSSDINQEDAKASIETVKKLFEKLQ